MNTLTTREAAARLGVSQVATRKLIGTGQLIQAGTVGRAILVDKASVDQLARLGTRPGRPWTEQNAWAALALLSGDAKVGWAGSSAVSRLRSKLRTMSADELPVLARRRASVRRFRATPDVVHLLRNHLLLSGAAAMGNDDLAERFGLTGGAAVAEGYALVGDANALRDAYGLIENQQGNVVIREVASSAPFAGGKVPLAAVALDLLESAGTRERSAGRRVIQEMLND
ncbi:helix-turn-helix domain-containing protein [Arthrobacter sp. ATA002]|uniref:helix-turn-helix domain-containing protein n=1 Tax=Arthrobacter sp. ATA002 TaxID=2991715 RepID=UPI0022A77914|nr:helix-turn-helix domain-containing protein [Arthrobacter sp. ATA002]WAP51426.1 helix-turn-helix domain-containing protein [Arthrobacter sp. ATA002]